jgi:hypothetical protein
VFAFDLSAPPAGDGDVAIEVKVNQNGSVHAVVSWWVLQMDPLDPHNVICTTPSYLARSGWSTSATAKSAEESAGQSEANQAQSGGCSSWSLTLIVRMFRAHSEQ